MKQFCFIQIVNRGNGRIVGIDGFALKTFMFVNS